MHKRLVKMRWQNSIPEKHETPQENNSTIHQQKNVTDPGNTETPHVCHYLPPGCWQNHPDRKMPAVRRGDTDGGGGEIEQDQEGRGFRFHGY